MDILKINRTQPIKVGKPAEIGKEVLGKNKLSFSPLNYNCKDDFCRSKNLNLIA